MLADIGGTNARFALESGPGRIELVEVLSGQDHATLAAAVRAYLASPGVYVGGGIVPRLGERFDRSCFRSRFEQKGRFASYLSRIPTYVITADYPAFLGVSAILSEKLSD